MTDRTIELTTEQYLALRGADERPVLEARRLYMFGYGAVATSRGPRRYPVREARDA